MVVIEDLTGISNITDRSINHQHRSNRNITGSCLISQPAFQLQEFLFLLSIVIFLTLSVEWNG